MTAFFLVLAFGAAPHTGTHLTPDQRRLVADLPEILERGRLAHRGSGPLAEAEYLTSSLAPYRKLRLGNRDLMKILWRLADARAEERQYAQAITALDWSAEIVEDFGERDKLAGGRVRLKRSGYLRQAVWTAAQHQALSDHLRFRAEKEVEDEAAKVLPVFLSGLQINRTLFGEDSPQYAIAQVETGYMLLHAKRYAEAMRMAKAAVPVLRADLGRGSAEHAHAVFLLAAAHNRLEQHVQAVRALRRWIDGLPGHDLSSVPDDLGRMVEMEGLTLESIRESAWWRDATHVLRACVEALRARNGCEQQRLHALRNFGILAFGTHEHAQAVRCLKEALPLSMKLEKPDSQDHKDLLLWLDKAKSWGGKGSARP